MSMTLWLNRRSPKAVLRMPAWAEDRGSVFRRGLGLDVEERRDQRWMSARNEFDVEPEIYAEDAVLAYP